MLLRIGEATEADNRLINAVHVQARDKVVGAGISVAAQGARTYAERSWVLILKPNPLHINRIMARKRRRPAPRVPHTYAP